MPKHANRVVVTSTTTGTGTLSLSGATLGHRTFASAFGASGNTEVYYGIELEGTGHWEVGIGTFLGVSNQLQRDLVLSSSTGSSKVSFPAGSKTVYVPFPAEVPMTIRARRATDVGIELWSAAGQAAPLIRGRNAIGVTSFEVAGDGKISARGGVLDISPNTFNHLIMKDTNGDTGIGVIARTDQTNFYLLLTDDNDANGAFNELRPFSINKATGLVTLGENVTVSGTTLRVGATAGASQIVLQGTDGNNFFDRQSGSLTFRRLSGSVVTDGIIEATTTTTSSVKTIITREKGDARYAAISSLRYKDGVATAGRVPGFLDLDLKRWVFGGTLAKDDFRRGRRGYGHVAEDVALVFPDGVENDEQGRPDRLNIGAMLGALHAEVKHLSARVDAIAP